MATITVATVATVATLVFTMMGIEAQRASRNERRQRDRGGLEPAGDVYAIMRVAYPGLFVAMAVEGAWRGLATPQWVIAGAFVFVLAKGLKWWAIVALGDCWTFRVIVVPGGSIVRGGPYRWLSHPNYVGVIGEIVGVALMVNARVMGPIACTGFGLLILQRLHVERRALRELMREPRSSVPEPRS